MIADHISRKARDYVPYPAHSSPAPLFVKRSWHLPQPVHGDDCVSGNVPKHAQRGSRKTCDSQEMDVVLSESAEIYLSISRHENGAERKLEAALKASENDCGGKEPFMAHWGAGW